MSQVFIRIDESHSSPEQLNAAWMRVDNEGQASPITRGPLSEAANQTLGAKVVLLVPSNDILLTQVAIPTQNRQRLLKAIPYAVEDQVIGDVEDMHFAVGERDDEKGYMTAVVDRRKMDYWQAQLLQNGLIADYVIPDVLAIPAQDDGWGLVVEEQTTLVRNQRYPSFAVDTENLGRVLPLAVKEVGEDLPGHITAWQCAANEQDVARIIPVVDERIELRTEECPKGLLGLIADNGFDAKTSLNLLQGDYSRREQVGKYLRPWFLTSILFGIWFVIQLALAITQGFTFNSELDQLRTESVKIFKQTFPQTTKTSGVGRKDWDSKLKALKGSGASGGVSFMEMLSTSGDAIRNTPGLILRNIRYKTDQLDLEVEVSSLQVLDQLKQKLMSDANMDVEIQSAASKENKVQGRLQIKAKK